MTKRGKKKTRRQQQVKLKCQKMKTKEDDIEVNKISRRQMKSLKAKEKKRKVKQITRKIYPRFYRK